MPEPSLWDLANDEWDAVQAARRNGLNIQATLLERRRDRCIVECQDSAVVALRAFAPTMRKA